MNQPTFRPHGLIWKETRQVIPLVLMLVGVAVFLVVVWALADSPTNSLGDVGHFLPLALPALYAAGAGAILIGQEKESRTLLWFTSLPIPPSRIFLVKLCVAFAGLMVMWLCCLLLAMAADMMGLSRGVVQGPSAEESMAGSLYWFVQSVFVLCCGFYTGWKFKQTFTSLVAIVPFAVVPYVVAQFIAPMVLEQRYQTSAYESWILNLATLVGIAVVGWLAYRAAMHELSPSEPEIVSASPPTSLHAWRPAASVPAPTSPFRFSLSSLVWQSIHHNGWFLTTVALAVILGSACMGLAGDWEAAKSDIPLIPFGIITGVLAVSWLGVFAFNGDGSALRMRFLAERGVSPTLAWMGRHAIGISIMSLGVLIYFACSYRTMSWTSAYRQPKPGIPSTLMVACVFWTVYSVSQWTSQWIRTIAASAVLAPVFSSLVAYWFVTTSIEQDAPFWLLLVCSAIPMLATWMMMRHYMDSNRTWPIWTTSIMTAGLLAILPTLPFAIEVAKFPGITLATRARLFADANDIPALVVPAQSMMRGASVIDPLRNDTGLSVESVVKLLDAQDHSPKVFFAAGNFDAKQHVPLHSDQFILLDSRANADFAKVRLIDSPDDERLIQEFGEWIDAQVHIAARLRLSNRWLDQSEADAVEIWLTQAMHSPALTPLLDREFAKRAITYLADQTARTEARRRAVLVSWRDRKPSDLGGYDPSYWFVQTSLTKQNALKGKLIDRLVDASLRLIEAGESGADTEPSRREMHHILVSPTVAFDDGPYSDQARASAFSGDTMNNGTDQFYVAHQWYGPWEVDAKRLLTKTRSASEGNQ